MARRSAASGLGRTLSLLGSLSALLVVGYALWRWVPWQQPAPTTVPPPATATAPATAGRDAVPAATATDPATGGDGSLPGYQPAPYEEPLPEPAEPAPPLTEELPHGGGARIALVIDDLGRSVAEVERLVALGVPVTFAVLPFESHTAQVLAAIEARNGEILCHLPMQGSAGANPGPGALLDSMSPAQLAAATEAALAAVPQAVGVNNHMGSVLSADRRAMSAVLGEVGERGLFFLDSRTTASSVAYRMAREQGIAAAERQVFLDRDPDPEAIRGELARLLAEARRRGAAIAIGHPYPSTFAVLAEEVPRIRRAGYLFVPVSYLVDDPGNLPR